MPNSLAIIGAGRVGRALGRRLRELGWKIGAVVARNEKSARKAVRFIGRGQAHAGTVRSVLASRVILVSVPDDSIALVARELTRTCAEELVGKIVLHTSGALDSRALSDLQKYGAAVGGMHPLQTFSGVDVPPLEGKVFAIEGDGKAVRVARQITRSLGGLPARIAPGKKILYHAAAAFAAGHVLAIEEAAIHLLISVGMSRGEAIRALVPLTRQVLDNYQRLGPRAAWTGPLSRGDYQIIAAHLDALRQTPPEFAEALASLNRLGARLLARNPFEALAELEKISSGQKAEAQGGNP